MRPLPYWHLSNCVILVCLNFLFNVSFKSKIAVAQSQDNILQNQFCPEDIADLANLLTSSISEYGNRVIQKTSMYSHKLDFFHTYMITAGKPEIEPLSFKPFQSSTENHPQDVEQIFFTTLERQYSKNKTIIETQNYHWLIMTKTTEEWKLVMAFTKFGYPQEDKFITSPPRDTTNGIIGQAVKLWLKDCHYGTLRATQNVP